MNALQFAFLFILFNIIFISSNLFKNEIFNEHLYIKPLLDGKVMFNFQFTTRVHFPSDNQSKLTAYEHLPILLVHHFKLFPKSFGQVVQKFNVDEVYYDFRNNGFTTWFSCI